MNNENDYSIIYSPTDGANISCNVHVPTKQLKDWERIKKNHAGNYYMTTLLRAVLRLAVGDKNVLTQATIGDFRFSYEVSLDRKDIRVHLIEIVNSNTPQPQSSGLYRAEWVGGNINSWSIEEGSL